MSTQCVFYLYNKNAYFYRVFFLTGTPLKSMENLGKKNTLYVLKTFALLQPEYKTWVE